jgi:hypothetical protein
MRKNIVLSAILTVCVVVLSFACVKTENFDNSAAKNQNNEVLTVAKNNTIDNKVLETRFLNMLNHNFVYNDDFYDDGVLVENSLLALLDVSEDSFVAETYVRDYLFNMYGKIYGEFESDYPEKEGYLYIRPRGYNIYSHEIASVTNNNDGSYTVVTSVTISYEDGTEEVATAETLFLKAEDSAFGFNMLYSDILESTFVASDC